MAWWTFLKTFRPKLRYQNQTCCIYSGLVVYVTLNTRERKKSVFILLPNISLDPKTDPNSQETVNDICWMITHLASMKKNVLRKHVNNH